MLNIEIEKTACRLENVNPRREARGMEDGSLGVDLKIKAEVPIEFLGLFSLPGGDSLDWHETFFDQEGKPKDLGVASVKLSREYEDHEVVIYIGRQKRSWDDGTVIKGITAAFESGFAARVSMQIQIHPTVEDSGWLNNGLLKKQIYMEVRRPKQMDLEEVA